MPAALGNALTFARKTTARWRSDFMSASAKGGRGSIKEFGPLARGQRLENANDRWFLVQKRGAAGRGRHAPGLYKVIGDFEALNGRCVARQRGRGVCAGGPVCPGGGSYGTSICASGGDGEKDGGELSEVAARYFAAVCLPLGRAAVTKKVG